MMVSWYNTGMHEEEAISTQIQYKCSSKNQTDYHQNIFLNVANNIPFG